MPEQSQGEFSYQAKSRIVALVDLILSSFCLLLSHIMIVAALFGAEVPDIHVVGHGIGDIVTWICRLLLEIISVFYAVGLFLSSTQNVSKDIPEKAEKVCRYWLSICAVWIVFIAILIGYIIAGVVQSQAYYMEITIMFLDIVIRLGACVIVFKYRCELKSWALLKQQNTAENV